MTRCKLKLRESVYVTTCHERWPKPGDTRPPKARYLGVWHPGGRRSRFRSVSGVSLWKIVSC